MINSEHEDNAHEELIGWCQQYIQLYPSTFSFFAGSSVEIPDSPTCQTQKDYGIHTKHFDIDIMYNMTHHRAFSIHTKIPETFSGDILRMFTHGVHPGYVWLIGDEQDSVRNLQTGFMYYSSTSSFTYRHGPATQTKFVEMIMRVMISKGTFDPNLLYSYKCGLLDSVFSIHCPFWPHEASEWTTRERPTGFPQKSLIQRIVKYGCDLVKKTPPYLFEAQKVSNKAINPFIHWRFSFSMAENLIIQNFTILQRIVYRTLRCLCKIILGKQDTGALSTYHLKTVMFWECENRQKEFWNKNTSKSLVIEILTTTISYLKVKRCPNYFIPENNMMDHLRDSNVTTEVNNLKDILTQDCLIDDVLRRSEYNEHFHQQAQCQIELPSWKYRFLLISQHFLSASKRHNALYCEKDFFETSRIQHRELLQSVMIELHDICFGLYFQRAATYCSTQEERSRYHIAAKHHLEAATHLFESSEPCFVDLFFLPELRSCFSWAFQFMQDRKRSTITHSPEFSIKKLHPEFCKRRKEWKSFNDKRKESLQKRLLYQRDIDSSIKIDPSCKGKFATYLHSEDTPMRIYSVFEEKETSTSYYEGNWPDLPGFDPTVSMSWFSAKAYLANFVFNIEHECSTVIKICDEINDVYHRSFSHAWLSDVYFPVIIATNWTAVYDKNIQTLLGFYSLCSFILNSNESRKIRLAVCPMLFSIYLKLRCLIDQNTNSSGNTQEFLNKVHELKNEWTNHLMECTLDKNSSNARIVLFAILKCFKITLDLILKP